MPIQIVNKDSEILKSQLNDIYELERLSLNKNKNLSESTISDLKNILSNNDLKKIYIDSQRHDYLQSFNLQSLNELHDILETIYSSIHKIKQKVDMDIFFKEGYNLDIEVLKRKFKRLHLEETLPKFNFNMLKEIYINPPKTIPTYYDKNKEILIDGFVFRKYLIGIIQMVFNHMDLLICASGPEGSGKSLKISQDMLTVHWILRSLNIIDYDFNIKDIWFNNLQEFREAEDKYFFDPFRIIGLDEGNELNRQDWKDEEVKTFFQRLRRERYNRRIKFICLPVLGELIPNIVLSRMNFIIDMINTNELRTATLYKGEYDFYIIPRGNKVYSPYHKQDITKEEIKSKLYINFKDKEYLKGLPKEILIKKCKNNDVWGFKKEVYEKELKESNKTYSVSKGITLSMWESFMIYKANMSLKKLDVHKDDIRYYPIHKVINMINHRFLDNPDLLNKYEALYNRRLEKKAESC